MKFTKTHLFLSLCILVFFAASAFAETAEVMPKGISSAYLSGKFYIPIDKVFKDDGSVDNPGWKYSGPLNSAIFPEIALIEAGFGLLPGSGNLGTTEVSFKYKLQILEAALAYGITDKLSAGIKIPY